MAIKATATKIAEKKVKQQRAFFLNRDDEKVYSLKQLIEYEGIFEDLDSEDVVIEYESEEGKGFSTDFTIQGIPMCCGVYEIGNLGEILPDRTMNNLFRYLFENNFTYIINTIRAHSNWEEYLERTNKFKLVKTFTNPNSGNEVKVWISTNKGSE